MVGVQLDLHEKEEKILKCVLVGDAAVGKTSLIVSYTTNGYPQGYVPTAFDNYSVLVRVDNQPIRLQLCDTAGQAEFDSLRPFSYPDTDVFLLCFNVMLPSTLRSVKDHWLPEITNSSPNTPIILVGTKCDLRSNVGLVIKLCKDGEQPVSEAKARLFGEDICAEYLECSALTQQNLKEVFDAAILVALRSKAIAHPHQVTKKETKKSFLNGFKKIVTLTRRLM